MTQDEIIEMAGHRLVSAWVIKLVCDAVDKEREACAKLAEEYGTWGGSNFKVWFDKLATEIRNKK
jgi:hypothetical protein